MEINEAPKKEHPFSRGIFGTLLMIIVSVSAGFAGGYFGSQSRENNAQQDQSAPKVLRDESAAISKIAKDVGPSVVSVNVVRSGVQETLFGPGRFTQASAGTGFIVSSEGVIVTNRHVVPKNVTKVSVTLSDGTELDDVEVIGRTNEGDPLDIAFLKVKDKKGKELKPVKLGDSSKVEVGDKVVAIGNALGQFQNTVTSGIISGYGRNLQAGTDSGSSEALQNLFQTDASINEGNSGGPLVNEEGEVIGINTAVAGGAENIGFAIPISDVQGIISGVLKENKLVRPYLGVRYITLTDDIAYELNLNTKRGAYIAPPRQGSSILPKSPAEKAGLKEKDIIVKINDVSIDEKNSLTSALGRLSVGDKVKLTIIRADKEQTIEVTLEALPAE